MPTDARAHPHTPACLRRAPAPWTLHPPGWACRRPRCTHSPAAPCALLACSAPRPSSCTHLVCTPCPIVHHTRPAAPSRAQLAPGSPLPPLPSLPPSPHHATPRAAPLPHARPSAPAGRVQECDVPGVGEAVEHQQAHHRSGVPASHGCGDKRPRACHAHQRACGSRGAARGGRMQMPACLPPLTPCTSHPSPACTLLLHPTPGAK